MLNSYSFFQADFNPFFIFLFFFLFFYKWHKMTPIQVFLDRGSQKKKKILDRDNYTFSSFFKLISSIFVLILHL